MPLNQQIYAVKYDPPAGAHVGTGGVVTIQLLTAPSAGGPNLGVSVGVSSASGSSGISFGTSMISLTMNTCAVVPFSGSTGPGGNSALEFRYTVGGGDLTKSALSIQYLYNFNSFCDANGVTLQSCVSSSLALPGASLLSTAVFQPNGPSIN